MDIKNNHNIVTVFKNELKESMYKYNITSLNVERDGECSNIIKEEFAISIENMITSLKRAIILSRMTYDRLRLEDTYRYVSFFLIVFLVIYNTNEVTNNKGKYQMQNIRVLSPSVSNQVVELPAFFQSLQTAIDNHETWMAENGILEFIKDYDNPEFVKYQLFLGTELEWQDRNNIENVYKSIKGIDLDEPFPEYIVSDVFEMDAINKMTSFETLQDGLNIITEGTDWTDDTNTVLVATCVESDDGASIILICGLIK